MKQDIGEIILAEVRALRDDLAPRVNKVERWQSNADGKITMFGAFCGVIGAVLTWCVHLYKGHG